MTTIKKITKLSSHEMAVQFSKFFTDQIFKIAVHSLIIEGVYPDETEEYQRELKWQITEIQRAKLKEISPNIIEENESE